jgi:hypothetical protein
MRAQRISGGAPWPRPGARARSIAGVCLTAPLLALALTGCGSTDAKGSANANAHAHGAAAGAPPVVAGNDCAHTVLDALTNVASRIYTQAASGRTMAAATKRIERSTALGDAVQHDDKAAVHHVLAGLIVSQIVRIHIRHVNHTLASYGTRAALAPASGKLRASNGHLVGRFTLSVQGQHGYSQTVAGLTGTDVSIAAVARLARRRAAARSTTGAPAPALTSSFLGNEFPSGKIRISVRLKSTPPAAVCGQSSDQTRANALGVVGERIYAGERAGGRVIAVARHVAKFTPLLAAVAAGNAIATRAAIVALFRTHLHIVRVRAMRANQLVVDVGGPYALAPVTVPLRTAQGQTFGSVQLAIQDDAGYMTLAHRFTGAQVLMRQGTHQIMGTLNPGPPSIPDHGQVFDGNTNYQAFSFPAEAFPSGVLRISLLLPSP